MAQKQRPSVLKRDRERKRAEKAERKRQKKAQRQLEDTNGTRVSFVDAPIDALAEGDSEGVAAASDESAAAE